MFKDPLQDNLQIVQFTLCFLIFGTRTTSRGGGVPKWPICLAQPEIFWTVLVQTLRKTRFVPALGGTPRGVPKSLVAWVPLGPPSQFFF